MLGFVDAIKRPLKIPPRFVPYMEKHKIYELFYELANELLVKKPEDHIVYLKQCLRVVEKSRNVPRIILIAPPDFDKMHFAECMRTELGVRPITVEDLYKVTSTHMNATCVEAEDLAKNLKRILRTEMLQDNGWILVGVPRTKGEAQAFQRIGIIPTHVIEIKSTLDPSCNETADATNNFHPPLQSCYSRYRNPEQRTYRKHLRGLRDAYSNLLIEVEIGDRSMEDLGRDCSKLAKVSRHRGAPSLFRIALIGSRGSGCRTLARHLAQRFNLVHVDFKNILSQARAQNTRLGKTVRMFESTWGKRPNARTRIEIVEKYVLGYECMQRGWVLTGYPVTVEDFKLMDMLATPPNRVFFVEVNSFTCKERLLGRRYNAITGSKHDLATEKILGEKSSTTRLAVHPMDYRSTVEQDIREYEENVGGMMQYAGESAIVIDGSVPEITAKETVEAYLIRPAPNAPPRIPGPPPDVDPTEAEFDPDDEPDPRIFDDILPPEPKLSFT